jgi:hypothetical protein
MSNYMQAEIARLTGWCPLNVETTPNTGGY